MRHFLIYQLLILLVLAGCTTKSNQPDSVVDQTAKNESTRLFFDVHDLEPGKIDLNAVAGAHQKDLATQGKYGVNITKYYVDNEKGKVYCIAEARDSASLYETHKEAHGLVPSHIREIAGEVSQATRPGATLFMDIHRLGPGNVTASDAAHAHEKDLATQEKYNTKFVNYWVDEKAGTVMCLVESADSASIANVHKEAHGLLPAQIFKVAEGH